MSTVARTAPGPISFEAIVSHGDGLSLMLYQEGHDLPCFTPLTLEDIEAIMGACTRHLASRVLIRARQADGQIYAPKHIRG